LHQETLLKQLREREKETFLKFETNQNLFLHQKKTIFILGRQVLDQEKNVISNHMNRHSSHRVTVYAAPCWLAYTTTRPHGFFFSCTGRMQAKGHKKD
jgi:hypothetical protein